MAEMESNIEVAVGTYEELILGYGLSLEDDKYEFHQSFTNHSHTGCVKKLAISQNGVLASGSTDETIWLFNLRKRREIGSLSHHSGTVTWLDFYKNSHLLSTSEDAKMCVWKAYSWECLRTFKGHKGRINCVAVHPSGKLALTVGQDRSLHTWNLLRGRSAYITNIKQPADIVQWSPDGNSYLILYNNKIDFYKVETASVYQTLNADRRINAVIYLRSHLIAYGGEGGDIVLYNCKEGREVQRISTDTVRIRDLTKVKDPDKDGSLLLMSASSDGLIKAFKVTFSQDTVSLKLIASHDTKFRLTCIAAAHVKAGPKVKTEDVKSEIKDEEDSDSIEVKEEAKSEDSDDDDDDSDNSVEILEDAESDPAPDKSSEADSGHIETSDSESSQEQRKSRKTSFLEFKKAQAMKRKKREEEKVSKKRKTSKGKGDAALKKMSPVMKKSKLKSRRK